MSKERADLILVKTGIAESREKAQRMIEAGMVLVSGQIVRKPSQMFPDGTTMELKARPRFVGRGGDKLEAAFAFFNLDVTGKICLDVGASTGGFTDCLLQHGAVKVYAVDVGKGQLDWKLRNDPKVVVIDETNARYLEKRSFAEPASFAAIDVSFISLTLVMPSVIGVMSCPGELVTLIKPQFEAGRGQVGKGGVVRDAAVREGVIDKVRKECGRIPGLDWVGVCESPLKGPAGNIEFLAYWRLNKVDAR